MKKVFLPIVFVAVLLPAALAAQDSCRWSMRAYGLFDTHYGSRTLGGVAALAQWRQSEGYALGFGAELATTGRCSLTLYGRANIFGKFYLENRYLYRQFASLDRQEFSGALMVGYSNNHWDFCVGLSNRYSAALVQRTDGGMGTMFEPMNPQFRVEGWWNGRDSRWNVGGRFSNMNDFMMERFAVWTYSVCGYYVLASGIRLEAEAGLHPVGSLNLTASYDGFYIHMGAGWHF